MTFSLSDRGVEAPDDTTTPAIIPPGINARPSVPSLRANTLWSLLGSIAPMGLGVLTIPYLIRHVGIEAFGILSLVWSIIGYFSVFDFGIGRALTHQVSACAATGDLLSLPGLIKRGLTVMLITGAAGGLLLAGTAHSLAYRWMHVSPSLQNATVHCLLLAAIGIPLSTMTSGLKGVLEGFEDFRTSSILRIVLGAANFGLPALSVVLLGPALEYMVASLVIARFLVMAAHVTAIAPRVSIHTVLRAEKAPADRTIEMFSFGAWMTASNIISPLMVTADRFVISFLLGAAVVAYYTVPFDVIVRLLVIPAALTGPLFPRLSDRFHRDRREAVVLYRRSLRVIAVVMAATSIPIIVGSFWGLQLWLGNAFAQKSWLVSSILGVGLFFNSIAQVPHSALQAAGGVKITSLIHAAEFIAYVPLLYFTLHWWGIPGAAVAWVVRVAGDFVLLNLFTSRRLAT